MKQYYNCVKHTLFALMYNLHIFAAEKKLQPAETLFLTIAVR